MIIQAVQFVCDDGDLFASMSWKSIIIASFVLFALFLTIL